MRALALLVALAALAGAGEGGEGASRAAVGAVMRRFGGVGGLRAPLTAPSLLTARLAAASAANGTQPGPREAEGRQGEAVPSPDYEEEEEEGEEALPVHQYIVDDLIRGEAAVPPRGCASPAPCCPFSSRVLLLGYK